MKWQDKRMLERAYGALVSMTCRSKSRGRSVIRADEEGFGRDLFDGRGAIGGCMVAGQKETGRGALVDENHGLQKVSSKCRNDVVLGRGVSDDDELVLYDECDSRGHHTRTCKAARERTIGEAASVYWCGLNQG